MALWRAVWMIQARGLSGTPDERPLVHRRRKRFLRRLFGQIEIADQADQRGDDAAPIRAIDLLDHSIGVHDDRREFLSRVSIRRRRSTQRRRTR